MSDLMSPPPWKYQTPNGYKYKQEVDDGYFLEELCLIAERLNDINETLKELCNVIEVLRVKG